MPVQKRAIKEKDKLKRKEKILKTAWDLYKNGDGQFPTVSVIAETAGLSKGSVYLYFKTKDDIILHLFIHQLRQWHLAVEQELEGCPDTISVEQYARVTTRYVVENPLLLRMGGMATGALGEQSGKGAVLDVKIQLAQILDQRSQLTSRLFPGLTMGQWRKVHLRIYALIFGLWQMFYSPPQVRRLLKEAKIEIFAVEFSQNVVESVAIFLKGALQS